MDTFTYIYNTVHIEIESEFYVKRLNGTLLFYEFIFFFLVFSNLLTLV